MCCFGLKWGWISLVCGCCVDVLDERSEVTMKFTSNWYAGGSSAFSCQPKPSSLPPSLPVSNNSGLDGEDWAGQNVCNLLHLWSSTNVDWFDKGNVNNMSRSARRSWWCTAQTFSTAKQRQHVWTLVQVCIALHVESSMYNLNTWTFHFKLDTSLCQRMHCVRSASPFVALSEECCSVFESFLDL